MKKKKKKIDVEYLSPVPSRCYDGSFEYKVFCTIGLQPFTKVKELCNPELRNRGEASARAFINCIKK